MNEARKKRLAQWLLRMASKMDASICVKNVQVVEDYEAKKIGLSIGISKNDIKENRRHEQDRTSVRESRRQLVEKAKSEIRTSIIRAIYEKHLIEFDVTKEDGMTIVSGELKVYIRKMK